MSARIEGTIIEKQGEEFLRVNLGGKDFDLPFKWIAGRKVGFLDISGQFELNEAAAELLVERLIEAGVSFDTIVNPVSKSNALAHAIAVRWAARVNPALHSTVVARKGRAGDHHAVEAVYRSVTTPVDQTLYLTEDDAAMLAGKRVLLVDDVYGGGGTTGALNALMEKAGATIAAHAVIGIEQGADIPADLVYLFDLPVI